MLFCVRVPVWVLGYPRGPTPAPRPRRAQRVWHDRAALGGGLRQSPNRPKTDRIRRRRERPEPARVRLFCFGIGGWGGPVQPSGVQVHTAARCCVQWRIRRDRRNGPCRLLHRRGRPGLQRVTLRCVAQPTETAPPPCVQVHTKAMGGTVWEARAVRGGREGGALRPPPHSPRHAPPCLAPHPSPRCLCRRCLPSALADPAGREATANAAHALERAPWPRASSCTIAPAGRRVEQIAPELLLPSAAQSAHAHALLCRSQRCGTGA